MIFKKNKKDKIEQPSLSPDQLELLSNRVDQIGEDRSQIEPFDNSTTAQAIRYAKKHKVSTATVIIGAISLIAILVFILVYGLGTGRTNTDNFSFHIGENKYTVAYNETVINNILYVDMSDISDLCEMIESGDTSGSRKYTLSNAEYIRFYADADYAVINGKYVVIEGTAQITEEACLVPYNFISKAIASGITFSYDKSTNVIKIKRAVESIDKNNNVTYVPVSFSADSFEESFIEYKNFGFENTSEMMSYIDPENANQKKYLLLVNHEFSLSSGYEPNDLVRLTCATNPVHSSDYYSLRVDVSLALYDMMTAMDRAGINGLQVSSSYRSYTRQYERFEEDVALYMSKGLSRSAAEKAANEYLARPGESEHQTGLCVDFVQGTSALTEKFENTTAFKWLSKNAHKFGFILRYPSDKVNETGYGYEPWHYRYVGRTVASMIYEGALCFEEYLDLQRNA